MVLNKKKPKTSPSKMTHWENEFFSLEGLTTLFPYFCKLSESNCSTLDNRVDVLSNTIVLFLTVPIQLTMNTLGVSLFAGKTSYIFPYYLMTPSQRNILTQQLSQAMSEYHILNECVVFKPSPASQGINILQLLKAFCSAVFTSKVFVRRKEQIAICNIVLQRIQSYVPISSSVQRDLNEWLKREQVF